MKITSAQQSSGRYRIRRLIAASAIGLAAAAGTVAVEAPANATTYAASVNECLVFRPTLKVGATNQAQCVAAVQSFLRFNYGNGDITVDGKFGSQTKGAVQNYQRSAGITADGVVGPNTWHAIALSCAQRGDCDYKYPNPLP